MDDNVLVIDDASRLDIEEPYEADRCRGVTGVLSRVGDKWSVLVVLMLGEAEGGTLRFNELRRRIGSVSQRMLTLTLRNLERDGLVTRVVHPTVPPRVDYALSDLGRSLQPAVRALCEWASDHHAEIERAHETYARRSARPNGK